MPRYAITTGGFQNEMTKIRYLQSNYIIVRKTITQILLRKTKDNIFNDTYLPFHIQ